MYAKRVQIINYGPIGELDIELPFDSEAPKPVVLVGANGSGKSIFLSHLVNGLLSAQAAVYPDSPEVDLGKVFKTRSNGYIRMGTQAYFARVDFEDGLHMGEIRTRRPKQDYQIEPEEFSTQHAKEAWGLIKETDNDHLFSNISRNNEDKVRNLFSNNCIQYFPHNRFEEPAWLNEANLTSQAELLLPAQVQGSTIRKVISYSPLKENQNWLFGVLFDRSVFETQTVNFPMPVEGGSQSVSLPVLVGPSGDATGIYEAAIQVVRSIVQGDAARFGIGRRGNRVVTIEGTDGTIVPNVFQLSSGETALLDLFLSILKDFDLGQAEFASAKDIRGIAIVDEIDLHLHTVHQYEILPNLMQMFPKVQFIVTTHSPLFVLGLAQTFGEDGFALYRMPQGRQISPEEFTEFGDAFRAFASTSKFSDDIRAAVRNAQTPILYLEGKTDVQYIRRAAELLGQNSILAGIEIDEREGGGNLKNTWEAVKNLPTALVPRKVMLLHDSDFTGDSQSIGNRFRLKIPFQADNPIERGIENLFSGESLMQAMEHKPDFIDVAEAHPGRIRGILQTVPEKWVANEDEKTNLCKWLCENGTAEDFEHFQVVFDLLQGVLVSSGGEECSSA